MLTLSYLLSVCHLLGLALGVGAATVKIVLRFRARNDAATLAAYAAVTKPITSILVLGIVLLTASGIGWLARGYPLTPLLAVKLVLVGLIWVLGISIDKVFEPRFVRQIPEPGSPASPEFVSAARLHLALDTCAALLMYVVMMIGTRL